jgi:hypothetical protein
MSKPLCLDTALNAATIELGRDARIVSVDVEFVSIAGVAVVGTFARRDGRVTIVNVRLA